MSVQTRTTAIQNEIVRLYQTFERDGRLTNPGSQPLVEILDTDGVTILATITSSSEYTGICYADWYIPANLPVGQYYDRWTFQWDANSSPIEAINVFDVHTLDSYINFVGNSIDHKISGRVLQLLKDLTNDFIYEAQHIPLYWEQGMRVQQESQSKRLQNYYYFTLDSNDYYIQEGSVYFHNGQRYTVFQSVVPEFSETSSSNSSESIGNISSESSSSSSVDSSSSSSSLSSESSFSSESSSIETKSSESITNFSSSSSSILDPVTTTTTTTYAYKTVMICVGYSDPLSSGTMSKTSGNGPATIGFVGVQKKQSRFSTIYNFAYKNWLKDPKPLIRLNNRIVDDGWFADYEGRVYFDRMMTPEDVVHAKYNFAYFSMEEMLGFLQLGLDMMNSLPPASRTYSALISMPKEWEACVLLWAAITALRRLIFGLNFQEKSIIFGTPEQVQQAIAHFQALLTEYMAVWTEQSKNAKTKILPNMMQVVTPEYTLPGGRSRFFRYMFKGA